MLLIDKIFVLYFNGMVDLDFMQMYKINVSRLEELRKIMVPSPTFLAVYKIMKITFIS